MRLLILTVSMMLSACESGDTPIAPEAPAAPTLPPAPTTPTMGETATGVPPLSDADYQMRDLTELRLTGEESMRDIANRLQVDHGAEEPVEGNYSELINIVEEGANVTIVFSIDGIPDDSLKAEQHVVEAFLPQATASPVTGYGVRYKCWRGPNAGKWTKELCP